MISVNEYFEGTVKSLGYQSSEGKSTVGVMEEGQYKFGTSSDETMLVIEGALEVLLPGEQDWQIFKKGESFNVPANSSFEVKELSSILKERFENWDLILFLLINFSITGVGKSVIEIRFFFFSGEKK